MKNDTTFVIMRSDDHLGDAKISKKGTCSDEFNFFVNCDRRKRFSQNKRRRSGLQKFASDIIGSAEALPILCVSDFCERERERERETPVTSSISRWNREWSCIWLPRRRVDPTRRRVLSLSVSARSSCKDSKDKELGAWALDRAAGSSDRWMTTAKWKLCVRWSACRWSPSGKLLACFKQEE